MRQAYRAQGSEKICRLIRPLRPKKTRACGPPRCGRARRMCAYGSTPSASDSVVQMLYLGGGQSTSRTKRIFVDRRILARRAGASRLEEKARPPPLSSAASEADVRSQLGRGAQANDCRYAATSMRLMTEGMRLRC